MAAAARVLGGPVKITGASRTDAGVHALRQVASLSTASTVPTAALQRALNALLPPSVRVLDARDAPAGFDARRWARGKRYAYLIDRGAQADPFLRSLNVAGIPWRFSGTSGLYARPEVRLLLAFLRAVADLSSSVDVYALAASDVYGLGGPDLTAIVTSARRRNRSVWEVLEELERQPGILRLSPQTRAAAGRLVADLRQYGELAHERPAGEVLYRFLRGTGMMGRLAATPSVAAEEALQNIARFFEMREDQGLAAAATEVEPSAPGVVMTARGKRMSRVTSAAIKIRRCQAGTYIVIVAA